MKKSLTRGKLSRRRLIAVFLSLSFIFGTAALTYAQARRVEQSATVEIFRDPEDNLIAWLTIRHYTVNPKFANMHAILKIQSNYEEDILVEYISIESWSDDKTEPTSLLYGKDSKTSISVPAGETVVLRVNQKAYNFGELIIDDDVWSYTVITWIHGANSYSKSQIAHTDAADFWHQLYP